MMVTDSRKAANRKWDAENMKLVATRLRVETAEEFARLCKANGDTMHSVLKKAIEDYISEHK